MTKIIKIAVDAMGGDNSPKKVIDGINYHQKNNNETNTGQNKEELLARSRS